MSDGERFPILTVSLRTEQDVVNARQLARKISELVGFEEQDRIRVATVVSELARNAFRYARGGNVLFHFLLDQKPQALQVTVTDQGAGIVNLEEIFAGRYRSTTGMGLGLIGSKRLMDTFHIETAPEKGTTVTASKLMPSRAASVSDRGLKKVVEELGRARTPTPYEEINRQNRELLLALEELRKNQTQLSELNGELEETNRGVVALYAELEEKAASLQRANEVKTSFLSNMTHEFRTPLSSIISLTRILLDRIDGDLSVEQEKQVKYIRQSGENLLELVNDLLDLAKVEAGKVTVKAEEFEGSEFLGGLRGVVRPLLPMDSKVELTFDAGENVGKLYTDEGKCAQVLRNLVSNSLKYTEKGSIHVGVVPADSVGADDGADDGAPENVVFFVNDTGIGIDPEHLEAIFQDFTQIESSLQKRAKGTGLGLPLSRKLARLLGGNVWAESVIGKGSTFFLSVPRRYLGANEGILLHSEPQRSPGGSV